MMKRRVSRVRVFFIKRSPLDFCGARFALLFFFVVTLLVTMFYKKRNRYSGNSD